MMTVGVLALLDTLCFSLFSLILGILYLNENEERALKTIIRYKATFFRALLQKKLVM